MFTNRKPSARGRGGEPGGECELRRSGGAAGIRAGVDVVTYEFENIPAGPLAVIAPLVALYPRAEVLHTTQTASGEGLAAHQRLSARDLRRSARR